MNIFKSIFYIGFLFYFIFIYYYCQLSSGLLGRGWLLLGNPRDCRHFTVELKKPRGRSRGFKSALCFSDQSRDLNL